MQHSFMQEMSDALLDQNVATLRYQFPYMEQGKRMPDRAPRLLATVQAAVNFFRQTFPDLVCVAGGKSMGGRMTSMAASQAMLDGVAGVVFLGFPLHPAGKPSVKRAEHLKAVNLPMLFVQGTRDRLSPRGSIEPVIADLQRADVCWIDAADHGFSVLKSAGLKQSQVLTNIAVQTAKWIRKL